MVSAEVAPFSLRVLDKQVSNLESLILAPDFPEVQIKQALVAAKKEVIASSFAWSSPEDLLKILQWGINPKKLQGYKTEIADYSEIIELLLQGIYGRLNQEVLNSAGVTADELDDLVESLSTLDCIQAEVGYLRSMSRYLREVVPPAHLNPKQSQPVAVGDAA
jgi:hypothetical protein